MNLKGKLCYRCSTRRPHCPQCGSCAFQDHECPECGHLTAKAIAEMGHSPKGANRT